MNRDERKRSAVELLAVGMASGLSLTEAARQAGVKLMTARRRAAEPAFRQRVEELRQAIVEEALGRLTADMTQAAATFSALLSDPAPQVRLAAAKAILDYRSRLKSDGELCQKVERLESLVKELVSHEPAQANRQDARQPLCPGREEAEGGTDDAPEGGLPGGGP